MPSITYSLLDEQMTQDDRIFFKQLGRRVANLRKELGITQVQLAEQLGISQQLIAAYEAGSRKIPASVLPTLAPAGRRCRRSRSASLFHCSRPHE